MPPVPFPGIRDGTKFGLERLGRSMPWSVPLLLMRYVTRLLAS
jgi:hypothetical protein